MGFTNAIWTPIWRWPLPHTSQQIADLAAFFQEAVVDTLYRKCQRCLQQTGIGTLVIVGGVGANQRLRELPAWVYYPRPTFCTDNGAMIALVGALVAGAASCAGLLAACRTQQLGRFTIQPQKECAA